MSISSRLFTVAFIIFNIVCLSSVSAMDSDTYKNQALRSIRLELWYNGISNTIKQKAEKKVKEPKVYPEELQVALEKQLAH